MFDKEKWSLAEKIMMAKYTSATERELRMYI